MDTTLPAPVPPLSVTTEDHVTFLTLGRPAQYNALSQALLDALDAALDAAAADQAVRVVVIAASGRSFCAGHDLKEMTAAGDAGFVARIFRQCSQIMLKIARLPVPVIAEVNGMATAAGCQLVAQCDLAVAADHAKFAVSGVNLGLFCSTPAVALSRTISRKRAAEMLMTGDFIDQLRATTLALADSLKAKPRSALATGKALFYRQLESGIEAAYQDASATIACNFSHADATEGVAAFLEKRKPDWA
jgi:enoyl-CoA hydratase/carnithine racemase